MLPHRHTDLLQKASAGFKDSELIGPHRPLLLMVSGGSDSVALLRLAAELCLVDTNPLCVLHINPMLRGSEADADEHFVTKLCAELSVECVIERVDVASMAEQSRDSVEQVGRHVRYTLAESTLRMLCNKAGHKTDTASASLGRIVTAHTADDRAETLLQRLIVGGGGGSLASIPRRNGNIVRPLLDCTRQELRDWLTSLNKRIDGALWREDASNHDTYYSRAFARHELMPLLEARNPRIIEGLNRTADVLAEESTWMDELANELLPLKSDSFSAPLPLLRRAIYRACTNAIAELAPGARITFEHIELIAHEGNRAGFACQIPGGIEVRNIKGSLQFTKAKPPRHIPHQ